MKRFLYSFVVLLFTATATHSQDVRTTNTRIADVLALLPAKDATTAGQAYQELMALDDSGLAIILDGVRPSGDASGVPYRYAVALLVSRAGVSDKPRIESALLAALNRQSNTEVKQYFLNHLALVGSDQSVPVLSGFLNDFPLADPSVVALEAIGSAAALEALRNGLDNKPGSTQVGIIESLGKLRDMKAAALLLPLTKSTDVDIKRASLWSLALIGHPTSESALIDEAAKAGYKVNPTHAVEALIQYVRQWQHADLASKALLDNTVAQGQEHYRLAAIKAILPEMAPKSKVSFLNKELDRFDASYRRDVFELAAAASQDELQRKGWIEIYKRSSDGDRQAEVLAMLAVANLDSMFIAQMVLPALDSKHPAVRKVAIQTLGATRNSRYADRIAAMLINPSRTAEEIDESTKAFLQIANQAHVTKLAKLLPQVNPAVAANIVSIMAQRRDVEDGMMVVNLTTSSNQALRAAAFAALPRVSPPAALDRLLKMLATPLAPAEVAAVQQAVISIAGPETSAAILKEAEIQKTRLLPVLPYLKDPQSLAVVKDVFAKGQGESKELAFVALTNWQTSDAVPELLSLLRDKNQSAFHSRALSAYLKQVNASSWPADQKLLKLREAFAMSASGDDRKLVIREAGSIRTFQSFAFVASYLDDTDLGAVASRAAMRLALPTADGQPGMTGQEVRKALEKLMTKLTGPDSQYDRIDVQTYLETLPYTPGFEPLFNGKDLTGWQGLVENPIARAKMTAEELARKQAAANAKLSDSWSVKDGMICFTGTGDNLCTIKPFGDFELLVDWKIRKNGDSGLYLRGSPQVQIWDTSRVDVGAQVGSGGLYNNTVNRNPLVVADNPIGDWNSLRITMIGERVTVYLNGMLVVDNVVMENYWDRKIPIFPTGPIELQAHGTELAFRDIYVRELNRPYQLTDEEKTLGYEVLFNGRDLSGWVGNKTDYVVDDHVIAIYPTGRGKGNLYTEKEYSDFVFRFEFQLTPAGNNGLGIHAPLEGDAAYVGKEIQILDDGHPTYANIQPYQAHGSVYGVIAAKRGFLKPAGQWNTEEVEVLGDKIKVTLNGMVIVDGDMRKASQNGTLDKQSHPGLQRHSGHIGFLGHGSVVKFRNIRIRPLAARK